MSEPTSSPPGTTGTEYATRIAGGSGALFLGGLSDKGFRLAQTWFLSNHFGPEPFGLYTTLTTVASILTTVTPFGMDQGAIVFGARYLRSGEKDRLKGTLITGVVLSLAAGVLINLVLFGLARWGPWWQDQPDLRSGLEAVSLVMMPGTLLVFMTGVQRGFKDMRSYNLAYQVALPALLLLTSVVTTWLGYGVSGIVHAFTAANAIAAACAIWLSWGHVAPRLKDRAVKARFEVGTLLAYSIPQSLTMMVFRLVQWMDILMLSWLGTLEQVGLYRVAVSLALVGSLPQAAVTTNLSPYIAELVYVKEYKQLDGILQMVTRWLFISLVPIYLVMLLLPDLLLQLFSPEYAASQVSLVLLLVGQAFHMFTGPTARIIPMAGHAVLNLVNAVAALVLNGLLCWLFIPRWGSVGAACATGIALVAWDVARIIQVWVLFRCKPMDRRTLGLFGISLVIGGLAWVMNQGHGTAWRLSVTALALGLFALAVWAWGFTPQDARIWEGLKARVLKKLGLATRIGRSQG